MRIFPSPDLKLFDTLFVGFDPLLHIVKRLFQGHNVMAHRLWRQLPIEFRKGSFECHEKHSITVKKENLDLFLIITDSCDNIIFTIFSRGYEEK